MSQINIRCTGSEKEMLCALQEYYEEHLKLKLSYSDVIRKLIHEEVDRTHEK